MKPSGSWLHPDPILSDLWNLCGLRLLPYVTVNPWGLRICRFWDCVRTLHSNVILDSNSWRCSIFLICGGHAILWRFKTCEIICTGKSYINYKILCHFLKHNLASLDTRACTMWKALRQDRRRNSGGVVEWARQCQSRTKYPIQCLFKILLAAACWVSLWVCVGEMGLEYCCAGSFAAKSDHLGKACFVAHLPSLWEL